MVRIIPNRLTIFQLQRETSTCFYSLVERILSTILCHKKNETATMLKLSAVWRHTGERFLFGATCAGGICLFFLDLVDWRIYAFHSRTRGKVFVWDIRRGVIWVRSVGHMPWVPNSRRCHFRMIKNMKISLLLYIQPIFLSSNLKKNHLRRRRRNKNCLSCHQP